MFQKPLQNPPGIIRGIFSFLLAIILSIFLFITLIFFNIIQMFSVILILFSGKAFRKTNREIANFWWGSCVTLGKIIYNIHVVYSGDNIPEKENAILFSNHQEMTDITFLMFFGKDKKRLGDMKYFAKNPIKYIPGIGWGLLFLDSVFLKRNWNRDKKSIKSTFKHLTVNKVPLWMTTFVEGTRITPQKHKLSVEYAKKMGITELNNVLVPRTKGFVASVEGLRTQVKAIYDITIGFPHGTPSIWQYLRGFAREAHLHIKRYPIEQIPKDNNELSSWLHEKFIEKDRLLDYFSKNKKFPPN